MAKIFIPYTVEFLIHNNFYLVFYLFSLLMRMRAYAVMRFFSHPLCGQPTHAIRK